MVVPYTLTNNDLNRGAGNLGTGEDFLLVLKESFGMLYEEGRTAPKMMLVGTHMWLVGHPGRASGLACFLGYVKAKPDVWVCRRLEITEHWRAVHPCHEAAA